MPKILSAVPRQLSDTKEKLAWLDRVCKKYRPDILVTPQEYFGGAVMMPHKLSYTQDELLPQLLKLQKKHGVAMVVGVLEADSDKMNREAIWFINENGEYLGRLVKFALPRYDHIATKGSGDVAPETTLENRFKTFKLCDMITTGMFCWEVYSDLLWTGLGLLKPDVVFSMIKFGVNAWPQVAKQKGRATVTGFGYGSWSEDGGWVDRLRMANVWQVKCPIICSTNSWNLRPISMPLCGCISGIDGQAEDTLWHPTKEKKIKTIPQKIQVDDINPMAVQAVLKNKFIYKELIGSFPPFSVGRFTMMLKINRIEDRLITGKAKQIVEREVKDREGGFDL